MFYLVWETISHDNSSSPCMGVEMYNTLSEALEVEPTYNYNNEYEYASAYITDTINSDSYASDWLAFNYGPLPYIDWNVYLTP